MENKNVNLEEINEGVPSVVEDVSKTGGNMIGKIVKGTLIVGAVVGTFMVVKKLINKRKEKKTEVVEIISEENNIDENAE